MDKRKMYLLGLSVLFISLSSALVFSNNSPSENLAIMEELEVNKEYAPSENLAIMEGRYFDALQSIQRRAYLNGK